MLSHLDLHDPKKMPAADSSDLHTYGENFIDLLLGHYGAELPAKSVGREKYIKRACIPLKSKQSGKLFVATYLCNPQKSVLAVGGAYHK